MLEATLLDSDSSPFGLYDRLIMKIEGGDPLTAHAFGVYFTVLIRLRLAAAPIRARLPSNTAQVAGSGTALSWVPTMEMISL